MYHGYGGGWEYRVKDMYLAVIYQDIKILIDWKWTFNSDRHKVLLMHFHIYYTLYFYNIYAFYNKICISGLYKFFGKCGAPSLT